MSNPVMQKLDELHAEHLALRQQHGGRTWRSVKMLFSPWGASRDAQMRITQIKKEKSQLNSARPQAAFSRSNRPAERATNQASKSRNTQSTVPEAYKSAFSYPFQLNNKKIQEVRMQALTTKGSIDASTRKDLNEPTGVNHNNHEIQATEDQALTTKVPLTATSVPMDARYAHLEVLSRNDIDDLLSVDPSKVNRRYGDSGFMLKTDTGKLIPINPSGLPADEKSSVPFNALDHYYEAHAKTDEDIRWQLNSEMYQQEQPAQEQIREIKREIKMRNQFADLLNEEGDPQDSVKTNQAMQNLDELGLPPLWWTRKRS